MPTIEYYTSLVPAPADEHVNTGIQPCPTALLVRRHGFPISPGGLTNECQPPTNPYWKGAIVTKQVHEGTIYGPNGKKWSGKVTGHHCAVELLEETFKELKRVSPELYVLMGTAGMLCVRHVRGAPGILSNHGLGMAIDLTIAGKLDKRGDNMVQRGMLGVYATFKKFGWYWGVEFGIEDGMHVEVGSANINRWIREKRL